MTISELLDLQQTLRRVPEWQLALVRSLGKIISVGPEIREGWSGPLEVFLLWCDRCEALSKDYGHSWPERRYVQCQRCEKRFSHPKLSALLKGAIASLWILARLGQKGGNAMQQSEDWEEEDQLAPAKGVFRGMIVGVGIWAVILAGVYWGLGPWLGFK